MKDAKVVISVVIPAYNTAKYLAGAVESALGQTNKPDEIIIVDDGSTDDTASVARSFGDRIRYFKQVNSGPAAARNFGIDQACGEWIAFLDADDAWLPWRLETQMKLMAKYPDAGLFCGKLASIGEDVKYPNDTVFDNVREIPLKEFIENNIVATSTVLARKEAIVSSGGFDASFRGPEDYDLWVRIAAKYRIIYIEAILTFYRSQSGSLSMDERLFLPQMLKVLSKVFSENGALHDYSSLKNMALAREYYHASWMAFQRGSRFTAVRYLTLSYMKALSKKQYFKNMQFKWIPLLVRYIFGPIHRNGNYTQDNE